MRLKLNKTLRAALIAAITAVGFTLPQSYAETTQYILTFGKNGTTKPAWADQCLVLTTGPGSGQSYAMGDTGVSLTMNISGGRIWTDRVATATTDTWNPNAIADMNATLGTSLTGASLNGLCTAATGYANSTNYYLLGGGGFNTGDTITIYVGVSGTNTDAGDYKVAGDYNVTGLASGYTVQYATDTGDGFSSTTSWTDSYQGALTMIKITGTIENANEVKFWSGDGSRKVGANFIAFKAVGTDVSSFTWKGTEDSHDWSDNVWNDGAAFVANSDALLDGTAQYHDVDITTAVAAKGVTVDGAVYTFNIGETGSLSANKLAITGDGAKLTVNGAGRTMTIGSLSNDGVLEIGTGATVRWGSNVTLDATHKLDNVTGAGTLAIQKLTVSVDQTLGVGLSMTEIALNGGTLTFASGTSTVSGKVYSNSDTTKLVIGAETGETAVLKADRIEMGDVNNNSKHHDLTINAGGTLKVTGSDTTTSYKYASLVLGEWGVATPLVTVKGKLIADKTHILAGDKGYTMNIEGGTVLAKGLMTNGSDRTQTINISNDGKLILGDAGIINSNTHNGVTLTVDNGTIGIYADSVTIDKAIALTGDVTFDTQKYAVNDITVEHIEANGTLTVSGNITGNGTITKTGAGELVLSGTANVINNTIQAKGGTLTLSGTYEIGGITGGDMQEYYVDVDGEKATNGFYCQAGTKTVYTADGGTVNDQGATYTIGGQRVDVTGGVITIDPTVTYTTLYVNQGTEGYAAYKAAAETAGSALTKVNLAAGTILTADAEGASFALALAGNGTVDATKAATVTALTGTGKLVVDGTEKVTVQSISGYTGGYEVKDGATMELVSSNMASLGNISVGGEGTLRLVTTTRSENNHALGAISAPILALADNSDNIGRYYYGGSTNFSQVGHLQFAGGQLWLTSDMTYGGKVTFDTTTYTEDGQPVFTGSAMRINANATFNGVVNVAATTKLAWADNKTITFANTVTGSGTLQLRSWNSKNGTFAVTGDASGYTGAMESDSRITLNVAENAQLTLAGGSNLAGAVTLNGILTVNSAEETTATISGVISGAGSLVKDGAGTLTLSGANTYTGTTMVNGGTLDIQGSIANSTVKVAENATLAGNTENISVGIASGKTATIAGDFTPKDSGVTFFSDTGEVEVQNTGDAEITYGIDQEAAQVTADYLHSNSETAVTVKNELVVGNIMNFGEGDLTLTHVATGSLQSISTTVLSGAVTLQNVSEGSIELKELCLSHNTVAVYKGEEADTTQECTVTITGLLMAGGGTLRANLILEGTDGHVDLDLAKGQSGMSALTLGSQFGIAEGTLVTLDSNTISSLEGLSVGGSLQLINAAQGTVLTYGDNNYNGMWFGQLFERTEEVQGDYRVYATETGFGLTKVSNVPEPTTGTLSLLALAALAARRRKR